MLELMVAVNVPDPDDVTAGFSFEPAKLVAYVGLVVDVELSHASSVAIDAIVTSVSSRFDMSFILGDRRERDADSP